MEEKVPDQLPQPGVPEALDPGIGNGALWELDPHSFILKSPDPNAKLDGFLIDESTHRLIINQWNGIGKGIKEEGTGVPQLLSTDVQAEPEKVPETLESNENQIVSRNKPNKTSQDKEQPQEEKDNTEKDAELISPSESIEFNESKIKLPAEPIGKVGKRVRKVVKKAKKEKEREAEAHLRDAQSAALEGQLSPFTQWLKNLRGSEYVHPYEDDYGLHQMSAAARGGVSETFADLLASQGHLDQARDMYKQLMEKYPEKSSFFAAKIEALH